MGRVAERLAALVDLVRIAYEEEIRYPAAALAYYAFVSFVPLLLLLYAVTGERLAADIARVSPRFLTPDAQRLVGRSLTTATGRTGAGALAALVLSWSGINIVGDVRAVVRRIEKTTPTTGLARVRDGVAILGSLAAAILAIVVATSVFGFPGSDLLVSVVGFLCLWATLALAFVPLYFIPSTVVESPVQALPGAVVASLGWTVLHVAVQFYVTRAGTYAVYGVLSGIIVILTSLYLAAAVLLGGIIVNAYIDGKRPRGAEA